MARKASVATVNVRTQEAVEVLAVCLYRSEKLILDRKAGPARRASPPRGWAAWVGGRDGAWEPVFVCSCACACAVGVVR